MCPRSFCMHVFYHMCKTIQPKVFPMSMRLKHNLYPTQKKQMQRYQICKYIPNNILFITLKKKKMEHETR
jgi:hypothetical protein